MPLVTKNRKYSRNFDRKQTENTKWLIEGQKSPERPQKIPKKINKYVFNIILKMNTNFVQI